MSEDMRECEKFKAESTVIERLKGWLGQKPLEELFVLRGEQYGSKEALVEDIIAHDGGCLEEILELEGSQLFLLMGRKR